MITYSFAHERLETVLNVFADNNKNYELRIPGRDVTYMFLSVYLLTLIDIPISHPS